MHHFGLVLVPILDYLAKVHLKLAQVGPKLVQVRPKMAQVADFAIPNGHWEAQVADLDVQNGFWDQVNRGEGAPRRHRGGTKEAPRMRQRATKEAPRSDLAVETGPRAPHYQRIQNLQSTINLI